MEYAYIDEFSLKAIEYNSLNRYTCSVKEDYYLACLDIASSSTITYTGDFDDNATYISFYGTSESHLFGSKTRCNGMRFGDGIINGYDLVVLMWVQFKVGAYSSLSLDENTVTLNNEVGDRCGDTLTREDYIGLYDPNTPCVIPRSTRRALSQTINTVNSSTISLHRHSTKKQGSWFVIKTNKHFDFAATELLIEGVDAMSTVPLSNDDALSIRDDVNEPSSYEVRFARHEEYCKNVEKQMCASIIGTASTGTALYHNVLSIGQIPTERTAICKLDIFLYIPNKFDCTLKLLKGSSAMNGVNGFILEEDIDCSDSEPDFTCTAINSNLDLASNSRSAPNTYTILAITIPIVSILVFLCAFLNYRQRIAIRTLRSRKNDRIVSPSYSEY